MTAPRDRPRLLAFVGATAMLLASCTETSTSEAPSMSPTLSLTSPAFTDGASIPARFTCDGEDVSPPLAWSGAPDGTVGFALLVDDPDARGFVHWVVTDLPADVTALDEGDAGGGVDGRNDFRRDGYGGPCPPSGTHRYDFTLVALSSPTGLSPGFTADELRSAIADRTLATATLSGSYERGAS